MKQKNVCTNTHRDSVNVDVLDKYTVTFQQTRLTEVWLRSRPCVCTCVRERATDSLKAQNFQLLDYPISLFLHLLHGSSVLFYIENLFVVAATYGL